jgi:hypothetical protein
VTKARICPARTTSASRHAWTVRELRDDGDSNSDDIVAQSKHRAEWLPFRMGALLGALVLALRPVAAQQLGYKLLGSAGIDAGVQAPPGLAVVSQTLHFGSSQLRDREGNVVAIDGLNINATGSALGVSYTSKTKGAPYLSFAIGVPAAIIHVSSDEPAASVNGYGFSDLFVQPIKVGWRQRRFDVVTAYVIYVPTGHFEPREGVGPGRGYWTHQLSLGGALFADSMRTHRLSALASYEQNTRKRGIDIQRGDMFQIQGGAGASVKKVAVIGLAGYALWQVTPDRGADIPATLRGQRSRVFGLGPEIDVTIPQWKTRVALRVEQEFGVESRPNGLSRPRPATRAPSRTNGPQRDAE